MKKTLHLLLALILIFAFTGCSTQDYVAIVNGEKINRADFDKRFNYETYINNLNMADPQLAPLKDYLELQVLNQMMDEALLIKEAEKRNLQVDQKILESQIKMLQDSFESEKEYKDFFNKEIGISEKDFKAIMEKDYLIRVELFQDLTKDINSVDADLQEYYEQHKEDFYQDEQVRARHILVDTEEEAKEIIQQIKDGAEMGKLAQEKSTDTMSAQQEGDLGFFTAEQMVPEFSQVAFSLKVGEISEKPVKSNYGYHIIRVEDKKPAQQLSFQEVEDDIKEGLLNEAKFHAFNDMLNKLRSEAKIENKLEEEFKAKQEAEQEKQEKEVEQKESEEQEEQE